MITANGHLLETEAEVDDWYNLSFKWWWLWAVGGLVVMITDAAFMMSIIMQIRASVACLANTSHQCDSTYPHNVQRPGIS